MAKFIHVSITLLGLFVTFLPQQALAQGPWTYGGSGDFDNNGSWDILWRRASGENSIWFMDKGIVISKPGIQALPVDWSIHGIADFNHDGCADILWRRTSGEFGIWFMNGTKVTAPVIPGSNTLGADWQVAAVGDFDGIGGADILWRRLTTGENSIWFMDGATVKATPGINPLSLDWRVDGVGDVNGDLKDDILWRRSSGEFGIWFMDGTKVTAPVIPGSNTLGADWQVAAVADFDNNKRADILWRRYTTGETSIWFMDGATVKATPGILTLPKHPSDLIQGVADFNGDKCPDIAYRTGDGTFLTFLSRGPKECIDARWDAVKSLLFVALDMATVPTGVLSCGLAIAGGLDFLDQLNKMKLVCGGYLPDKFPGSPSCSGSSGGNSSGGRAGGSGSTHESHDRPNGTSGQSPAGSSSSSHGQFSGSISSGGVRLK